MAGLYGQCQECMGPLPPEAIEDDEPFCSLECEQITEEEYLYGYPGADEAAIIGMVQRYGAGPILRHLDG
jgi:hypothetical protein